MTDKPEKPVKQPKSAPIKAAGPAPDTDKTVDEQLSPGLQAVIAERFRVINDKGRTAESDDLYVGGELVQAAACYASIAAGGSGIKARAAWPFELNTFKPGESTRDLVKSAQFLIAELDRRARLGDPALTSAI